MFLRLDDFSLAPAGAPFHQAALLMDRAATYYGTTDFNPVSHARVEISSSIYAPRGQGYGSILLVKAIELAGARGYPEVGALIGKRNRPSYQRFDRLVAVGLARKDTDDSGRGDMPDDYFYLVPTAVSPDALYRALLPKVIP